MARKTIDPGRSKRLGVATWRLAVDHPALEAALARVDFESAPDHPHLTLRKQRPRVFWAEMNLGDDRFFIKGRREGRVRRLTTSMVKVAPLRKEWQKTWRLRSKGLDTVEPVAVGERRRFRCLYEEFFVSRWLDGAAPLQEHLARKKERLDADCWNASRQEVVRAVGRLVGVFHTLGAYHRQLYAANVLAVEESESPPRLVPVDFKHVSTPASFTDEDWLWSFHLLLWWLGEPVIRWETDGADLASFASGYREGLQSRAPEPNVVFSVGALSVDALVECFAALVSRRPTAAPTSDHRARYLRELPPDLRKAVAVE